MIKYDTHLHSSFSTDSEESLDNIAISAMQKGLEGIIMTDHMDIIYPTKYHEDFGDGIPFIFNVDNYVSTLADFKKKYSNLRILTGMELGLHPDAIEKNVLLSNLPDFDQVIGSVHVVDEFDPYYPEYWESYGEEKGILKYFETILDNLENLSNIRINTLGHMDYVVRYAPSITYDRILELYDTKSYMEVFDEIFSILIDRKIALEVNSSALKKGFPLPNPATKIIKQYKDKGGELLTFGSDAHAAENIAFGFDKCEEIAKSLGFKGYNIYVF
ncbi:MAG: histidinol-phosphatase HisJ family protein, partial [Eubacterium sp.]|nr:histidinol-phosphatase HisJ family protein [Eubacterium sp.]